MQNIFLMVIVGVSTGVVLSYIYKMLMLSDKENSDNRDETRETDNLKLDIEDELKICANCGAYNEKYSSYCYRCVSGIHASRTIEPENVEADSSERKT